VVAVVAIQRAARIWGRRDLYWRQKGTSLILCASGAESMHVIPDARFEGLWRVAGRGQLSDMLNLSRAKDCAASLTLAALNRPTTAQETRPPPTPIGLADVPVTGGPELNERTCDLCPDPSCTEGER
jgi:hypothetical protein